jgi:hypothetical protein
MPAIDKLSATPTDVQNFEAAHAHVVAMVRTHSAPIVVQLNFELSPGGANILQCALDLAIGVASRVVSGTL